MVVIMQHTQKAWVMGDESGHYENKKVCADRNWFALGKNIEGTKPVD